MRCNFPGLKAGVIHVGVSPARPLCRLGVSLEYIYAGVSPARLALSCVWMNTHLEEVTGVEWKARCGIECFKFGLYGLA